MAEVLIRPTLKFIKLGYVVVLLLVAIAGWFSYNGTTPAWLPGAAAVLLVWPIQRHLRRQVTKMTIAGDKMRYETGFLSKMTRTIQLSKVQDVTVHQTLGQRILGVGDLSIETAGESSRLTVHSIDRPQHVADEIIEASHREASKGSGPPGGPGPAQGQGLGR
jgi:uncharacterized membrane protein YdbT with pleckstrin-like domain